ncbi:MAG TPA: TonB-dependent receptor plug domain-containing protein [Pedobacter sp.]|nr:TonB-dependent receptor plug domain-containing protein [Pedobacter sp.]
MKKLIILSLIPALLCGTVSADAKNVSIGKIYSADDLGKFYSYLMQSIEYPSTARLQNHQGNSIITFTLIKGNLKHINIHTELGNGCDVAVLNSLMAYSQLNTLKDGLYALQTSFRIKGASTAIINNGVKMPIGFTALNTITIMAQASNPQAKSNADSKSIKIIGYRSTNKQTEPLYIVDGKVFALNLNELDPNTIESVSILKDASAISLYGTQGANGVVVITTKNAIANGVDKKEPPAIKQAEASKNNDEVTINDYGSKVKFRGTNTYGKNPLYILDGKVLENENINQLDPNKIESISILKDASAIALYGSSGQNGVIIVTTKNVPIQKTKNQ